MTHSPTSSSRSHTSAIDPKAVTPVEPHPEELQQLLQREQLLNRSAQRIR